MKFFRLNVLALALLWPSGITFSQSLDPHAPTHGVKSASEIDREWQDSVAQFNAKRSQILSDVDRQAGKLEFHQSGEALEVRLPAPPARDSGVVAGYALALRIETRTHP